MSTLFAYVGTYSRDGGSGIVVLEFCSERGRFIREVQRLPVEDASYLARHPRAHTLFCVNEVRSLAGAATGGLSEFAIESGSGQLRFRQQVCSGGATPAHLAIDADGGWLGVANYRGATFTCGRLDASGHVESLSVRAQLNGRGVHAERQTQPHPHQVVFHRNRAWIPDLGTDRIASVNFAAETHDAPIFSSLPAGFGPRHLTFAASGNVCFVVGELSSKLAVLESLSLEAPLVLRTQHSTRAPGATGPNQPAALRLHPSGQWLFCSNRGDDTVAVFGVAPHGDAVELHHVSPCGGWWPRDLAVTPDGRWLIVVNQRSGALTVFPFASEAGHIGPASDRHDITAPACVLISPPPVR